MGATVRPRWLAVVPNDEAEVDQPMEGQTVLFPELAPPSVLMSLHFEKWATTAGKVSYTVYALKTRAQCEECVWVAHERQGRGPSILPSAWRRRSLHGEQLLCHLHKQAWELRDAIGTRR